MAQNINEDHQDPTETVSIKTSEDRRVINAEIMHP